jgi:hypothetical protein
MDLRGFCQSGNRYPNGIEALFRVHHCGPSRACYEPRRGCLGWSEQPRGSDGYRCDQEFVAGPGESRNRNRNRSGDRFITRSNPKRDSRGWERSDLAVSYRLLGKAWISQRSPHVDGYQLVECRRDLATGGFPARGRIPFTYRGAGACPQIGAVNPRFVLLDRLDRHARPNGRDPHISFPTQQSPVGKRLLSGGTVSIRLPDLRCCHLPDPSCGPLLTRH